jgi:[acyl-carrier-protein] S-malonyltransferase
MGKERYDHSPEAKALMEKADAVLGFPLTEIMFEGSPEDLRQTNVTQPAIFVVSVAASLGLKAPDMVAGHSLGEFSALTVAGAMGFEDALRLVSARAEAMQRCCERVPGMMAAVIALPDEEIERICAGIPGVVPANYNSPGQVVISGEEEAVRQACKALKEAGAKRALPLPVSGAFHSPLMEPARAELAEAIARTRFHVPVCPVYQNVTALPSCDPDIIRENLLLQLTSPVRWTQSVRQMRRDGAETFLELGPGEVLTNLIKRIQ